jgi:hypothetical protein
MLASPSTGGMLSFYQLRQAFPIPGRRASIQHGPRQFIDFTFYVGGSNSRHWVKSAWKGGKDAGRRWGSNR